MKTEIISKAISLENPNVKRVLKIAEEIMNSNKVLNIENLYNIAKRALKIPRKGLLRIIQFLINKKILIEGSKYSKKTVLSNQIRNNIYKLIKKKGAVHFSHIKREIGRESTNSSVSSGQLIWHLEMLLKFNYIKKCKLRNYTIFFPVEINEETAIIIFILSDKLDREIVNLISNSGVIKKSDVYKILEEKREKVYYHIAYLIEYNIIVPKQKQGKMILINPKEKNLIDSIIKERKIIFNI